MSDQMVFYKDNDETHQFWMILQGIGSSGGEWKKRGVCFGLNSY